MYLYEKMPIPTNLELLYDQFLENHLKQCALNENMNILFNVFHFQYNFFFAYYP